jgi:hypothetical protein
VKVRSYLHNKRETTKISTNIEINDQKIMKIGTQAKKYNKTNMDILRT